MSERYLLGIDQSTAGTKALLFDGQGRLIARRDRPHAQKLSPGGWVSHDPMEIYRATLLAAGDVLHAAAIDPASVAGIGISNQRETSLVWHRGTGLPIADAVVWQCARGEAICARLADHAEAIRQRTGLPLSPYFSAAKIAWLLENTPVPDRSALCAGTIDAWLVFKLTGQFKTDWSNASRTQLLNLHTLAWDAEICAWFGIDPAMLPEIHDSNACFGHTDLDGLLPGRVPVHAVLGDSHGALFSQGCHERGMVKATYGTGSSVMLNIGDAPVLSDHGAATSIGWGMDGKITYVMEGNINYAGAVIKWLVEDVGLISSPKEAGPLARQAKQGDTTYLVPAFSGLGAPYWDSAARAAIVGMTRGTGKAEIARAAELSIALQIVDVMRVLEKASGTPLKALRADGGATRDDYLMQAQSDLLGLPVDVPGNEELSGMGAAHMAGIALGLYAPQALTQTYTAYTPQMSPAERQTILTGWTQAVTSLLHS